MTTLAIKAVGRHTRARVAERTGPTPADLLWLMAIACLVWFAWPASFGGRLGLVLVAGTSMEPTYKLGDVAITWKGQPGEGDVVLYLVPDGVARGQPVIHRIVGGSPDAWIVQGDNNALPDEWMPATGDVLGVAVVRIPIGGRVLWMLRSPLAVAALAGTAVALWMWPEAARRGRHLRIENSPGVLNRDRETPDRPPTG
jgi:signal peptidase I